MLEDGLMKTIRLTHTGAQLLPALGADELQAALADAVDAEVRRLHRVVHPLAGKPRLEPPDDRT